MLLHIITPKSAYILLMVQSYNNFIFTLDQKSTYTYILFERCADTYIFIFLLNFSNITPTALKILIFYSNKLLSCSSIYLKKNEVINQIFNKTETEANLY